MGGCIGGICNSKTWKPVTDGITVDNPILRHTLGICSSLAVTGFVNTTLVMCVSLLLVTAMSNLLVSLIRNIIPHRVRMIAEMLVISVLVIIIQLALRAYWYEMAQALGPYVGLIITNCIVMGRAEAYALRNGPVMSFLDGFGSAAGYSLVLLLIAFMREPLGAGTLLGFRLMPEGFVRCQLVGAAPGAFLAMGVVVWVVRSIWPVADPTEEHPEATDHE